MLEYRKMSVQMIGQSNPRERIGFCWLLGLCLAVYHPWLLPNEDKRQALSYTLRNIVGSLAQANGLIRHNDPRAIVVHWTASSTANLHVPLRRLLYQGELI